MKQQYGDSEDGHPLSSPGYPGGNPYSSNDQGSKSEYNYSNQDNINSTHNHPLGYHNVSPQQQEQLELQKQHQQRLQEQIQTQESVRMQQHRVARPNAAAAVQDNSNYESKPANYYAYPPQPSTSSAEFDQEQQHLSLKARLTKLVKFPCSIYGKSLLLVFSIEALLVIIMQIIIVVIYFKALRDSPLSIDVTDRETYEPHLDPRNLSRAIVAYLIVFVFAQLFQIVMAWDAVSLKTGPLLQP